MTTVTVSGRISEFFEMTEMTLGSVAGGSYSNAGPSAQAVVPQTVLPGTDCALPGTGCLTGAALAAEREKHEGELFQPTAPFTVSDSYDGTPWAQAGNRGFQMAGEIGLAANDTQPLIAPTEAHNPGTDPAGLAARNAYNNAHMITLDDGANIDFSSGTNRNIAFPWLTPSHTVRMGAAVTFPKPVVLDYRNDLWKLQPQGKVTGDGETFVSIEQDRPAAPDDVLGSTGDLKIATFNMLNYFNTTARPGTPRRARRPTAPTTPTATEQPDQQQHLRRGRDRPAHRAADRPPRPAWCREPGELRAPGGQGARGHQHDGRRRDVAGGGRELDQDR